MHSSNLRNKTTVAINAQRAFTLIELLVVISIISLLSSVVLSSLSNARASARDTRRIQDMNQLLTALELYYNNHGRYPEETVTAGNDFEQSHNEVNGEFLDPLVDGDYLSNYIVDPLNVDEYHYIYYHFDNGYRGCPDSGFFLGIRRFESIDGTHPNSPEFDCDGATNYWTTSPNRTEWVTGSYD